MTILTPTPAPAAYSALHAVHMTAEAVAYTIDELDDLTDRKIEDVPISGDTLARIVRAQRGTARATGQPDPYGARHSVDTVQRVWGSYRGIWIGENTSRRMAAVGNRDGVRFVDAEDNYSTI